MMKFRIAFLLACLFLHTGWIRGKVPDGGKAQLGFHFLSGGDAYPFINHLKNAAAWANADATRGGPTPDSLDSNGWPTSLAHSGVVTTFYVPPSSDTPGVTWNIKVTGGGTISVSNTSGSSCAFPCAALNQTITGITFSSTSPTLTISALNPAITDIAIYRSDEATEFNAGEVFSPAFKSKVTEGGFGAIRFLNWQLGNTSNLTQWADRTPTTYAFYGGYTYKAAYYAGTSGGTGTAYTATLGSGAPTDRQTIHILWHTNATTTTPTLNLNGSGAVTIADNGGNALVLASTAPESGRTSTLVYDATLNKWLNYGGSAANFNQGIVSGVPPELLVQLANELGMNPWFVSPPYVTNPLNSGALPDYIPQLATYVRDNLASGLVPKFEGVNELWNSSFFGTSYAVAKATAYGWSGPSVHQYQGMAISLIGQAVSAAYSDNRSRYWIINGVQQSTGTVASISASDPRMNSDSWVAAGSPTATGYTVSAAKNWVTHVAPSTYIGSAMTISNEIAAAYSYTVTNAGNPTAQAALADTFIAGSYIGSPTCTAPYTTNRCASGLASKTYLYTNWYNWAQGFTPKAALTSYEGGWSPDYFTVGSAGDSLATGGDPTSGGNATITAISAPAPTTTITLAATNSVPAIGMAVRPIGTGTALSVATASVTISTASPGVVSWTSHGLLANQPVVFQNGTVPTGLAVGTVYYVKTVLSANTFSVSATAGGAAINTSGSAGAATGIAGWTVTNVVGQVVTLDVDSSSFGTSSAGTAQFMGAALMRNTLRYATKARPALTSLELNNMAAFATVGGVVPADYAFTGDDLPESGIIWSNLFNQFVPTSPRWDAYKSWNAQRPRM